MTWLIPHCTPPQWPADIPAGRFAAGIRRGDPAGCRVALLGLPDDLGIRLNNGRPGAAEGPKAFRAALVRYGAASPCGWEYPAVFDAGDVIPADGSDENALHETHRRVSEAVGEIMRRGLFPIAIGGGHDLTFPFVRGVIAYYRRANPKQRFEGAYFDAHLDVRDTVGSGMPFRRLVEACGVAALDLYGFSPFANTPAHLAWFLANGGRVQGEGDESLAEPGAPGSLRFVSLDLDVVDASAAPGVSAMNPCGLLPAAVAKLVEDAGRSPDVACFDIMELSPRHDHEQRTARLAAHMFLTFLRGLAGRWNAGGAS